MTSSQVFNSDIHIIGDVRIDDHAVIAPGVIIQAAQDCSVVIASGVCLGMGSIIQAHQGDITIHKGAIIGGSTLIIGTAEIGENSCVGYGTTIFYTSVQAGEILPPNSLIGVPSRQSDNNHEKIVAERNKPEIQQTLKTESESSFDPWSNPTAKIPVVPNIDKHTIPEETADSSPESAVEINKEVQDSSTPSEIVKEEEIANTPKEPVVGQAYINQLMTTLFPKHIPDKDEK